ncbi:tRNA-dihydrouridine(20a/20b) synthase [NAD(P)+]-like [Smittium mucronatum]|uniref:tRNA-dihydrouridine(20a/20b) synthase [NAD(P)+]-like n=1 Tax=Smittium mucronatum TaxID=133383 RepID=A0A1R0GRZ6_9FUNG|nr:tRNA-dihydrouridine(20a/20b) synthase [NAD(P)+]-like [Smittium mucronatum]
MMLADVFRASEFGREDFTTNERDTPLVLQFAANNYKDFSEAAEIVAPYVDGLDLNCGCPQKWAIKEGYGSYLLDKPEKVADMVRAVKNRVNIPCSIKIRKLNNPSDTIELVRRAEAANVDWITIHGRTKKQSSSEPVDMDIIKLVKQVATVPVIANGGVFTFEQASLLSQYTGVDAVMSARGLLQNPALFSGYDVTPLQCIKKFGIYQTKTIKSWSLPASKSSSSRVHQEKAKKEFQTWNIAALFGGLVSGSYLRDK